MKKTRSVWEYIRVKFKPGTDPKGKRTRFSRPTRIYMITIYDEKDEVVDIQFAPPGVKGTSRRIIPQDFITEWEHGPVPTPKPSRKYSDEQLKGWGYSEEVIKKIRRNFSSKDVKLVSNRLSISRTEATELLTKFKGSKYAVYMDAWPEKKEKGLQPEERETTTIKINGKIHTLPVEKFEYHRRRIQYLTSRNIKKSNRKYPKKHTGFIDKPKPKTKVELHIEKYIKKQTRTKPKYHKGERFVFKTN